MPVLPLLYFPDIRLRQKALPVQNIKEIQLVIDDMFETMYANNGIGLAATQVNIHQRIIVIDISESRKDKLVLINPELLNQTGKTGIEEGCLSIPKQHAFISRSEFITVHSLDRYGNFLKIETRDLLSICIQHEIDHLNGKLFIDYLSPLKRARIKTKLEKLSKLEKNKKKIMT
ncbi:peptide deformylase [Candidatus Pantoea edessiphila]|uniref:Peptide deformylase n=1 Tax=Candidatus Pantoea edessiphila TaxID=2044610 RepID=A0A2P5SZX1_9GAMM|nr:peptide deformylase [Candidatus Pantoea edessiphila]PPI87888.1 peptide deformylase [Candidatus Pantoea edessiphila]